MRHALLVGAALGVLAPCLAAAQEPPRAAITATPLMPPSMQYPSPPAGSPGTMPQPDLTPQPGVLPQPSPLRPGMTPQPGLTQQPGQLQPGQLQPGQPQPGVTPQPGQPHLGAMPQPGQPLPPTVTPPGQPQPPVTPQVQPPPQPGQAPIATPQGAAPQGAAPQEQPAAPGAPLATPGQASPQAQGLAPAPPPPNIWVPQAGATLQLLDKVNAQTTTMTVKNGQTVTFGSLSITVQSCEVRPPDMPQDATAFLTIVDSHPGQPGFKGWMLESEPSLSMLEHPLYDVRLAGCTP